MTTLSIVIASFNRGLWLQEAVKSGLNQTVGDAVSSVIVVDDGSTEPQTIAILAELEADERVTVLRQENRGVSAARNTGIAASSARYILCLDDDDVISETYVEKAIEILEADDSIGVVYSMVRYFGAVDAIWELPEFSPTEMALRNCVPASGIFRRSDWALVGGYCESLRTLEDWDFWLQIMSLGRGFHQIHEELFYCRIGHSSLSRPSARLEGRKSLPQIVDRNRDFFSSQILAIYEDRSKLQVELERWKSRYSVLDQGLGSQIAMVMRLVRLLRVGIRHQLRDGRPPRESKPSRT